jgi:hypothetical protein
MVIVVEDLVVFTQHIAVVPGLLDERAGVHGFLITLIITLTWG